MSEPKKKIRARVQKSKRVFVHNDLSHAAMYFKGHAEGAPAIGALLTIVLAVILLISRRRGPS